MVVGVSHPGERNYIDLSYAAAIRTGRTSRSIRAVELAGAAARAVIELGNRRLELPADFQTS